MIKYRRFGVQKMLQGKVSAELDVVLELVHPQNVTPFPVVFSIEVFGLGHGNAVIS